MSHAELAERLRDRAPAARAALFAEADAVRRATVGEAVHLRGLVEISNHCMRACHYCGLSTHHAALPRYRLTVGEITAAARTAAACAYGTVVLQSGEDPGLTPEMVSEVIRTIKRETGLAVTLSLGERTADELIAWRAQGADRYLLRFETGNRELYQRYHPDLPAANNDRLAQLQLLRDLGYEVGSGVLVGLPGQTFDDLAADISLFSALRLDMIGVGPFIPHPATPLGRQVFPADPEQVPNTADMALAVIALSRLELPQANIPSTTALATLNPGDGYAAGLRCGANVVMPNVTPARHRVQYEVYPGKSAPHDDATGCDRRIRALLAGLGRTAGAGRGDSPAFLARRAAANRAARDASSPAVHSGRESVQ